MGRCYPERVCFGGGKKPIYSEKSRKIATKWQG